VSPSGPTVLVEPVAGTETKYGKKVSDLQDDVVINTNRKIDGTLHYVTRYTEFNSSEPTEQEGNYLALDFSDNWLGDTDPTTFTVELKGGKKGPVTLTDGDAFCVFRVTNPNTQSIEVVSTDSTGTTTVKYSLKGLTLEPKE
jgi:hypothetical protein